MFLIFSSSNQDLSNVSFYSRILRSCCGVKTASIQLYQQSSGFRYQQSIIISNQVSVINWVQSLAMKYHQQSNIISNQVLSTIKCYQQSSFISNHVSSLNSNKVLSASKFNQQPSIISNKVISAIKYQQQYSINISISASSGLLYCLVICTQLDLNDGQFLIAMRCRCSFYNNDAMSMFLAISYHRNRCNFCQSTIGGKKQQNKGETITLEAR